MRKILVTGAAGFIGYHLCRRLVKDGEQVVGVDNLNDYYDVRLKLDRLQQLDGKVNFRFIKAHLENREDIAGIFSEESFEIVINLAAQPGVRYSLDHPYSYVDSNVVGFQNVLEGCRHNNVQHLVFASSSSVYGANTSMPFSVHDNVDHPVSLYAATKKANELMAHAYSSLFNIPCTGLRFFTVYGPWGRPDMAYFLFTKAILEDKPINVFNHGKMQRDFTYIDDVIEGVVHVLDNIPKSNPDWNCDKPDSATSYAPYRLYNIGNNVPVELLEFIETLEEKIGKKAKRNLMPMQAGDVQVTCADVDDLIRDVGFKPSTSLKEGISNFVDWYEDYYHEGKGPV